MLQVVDTPGFGDSEGRDNQFIVEMMDVLKNDLGYTNIITLVIEGSTPRFGEALYNMLRQMTSIFGNEWWDFMVVGVSKWSYDQDDIDQRNEDCTYYPDRCQDEAWFIREFNSKFQEKFGLTKNFTFAFVDSWSQTINNIDDEVQQQYWIQETEKLWKAATNNNQTFEFKTIDDVLEENAACKEENLRLNDIIDEDIANLKEGVQHNADTISAVISNVSFNTKNININYDQISLVSSKVDENQENIQNNQDNMSGVANSVAINSKHIADNSDEITLVSTTLTDEISSVSTSLTENINEVSITLTESINAVSQEAHENQDAIENMDMTSKYY